MNLLPPILLVDDNADDRELVTLVLTGAFGEVVVSPAADAAALTRALSSGRFGLVITEYDLPWTSGEEVVRLVRELRPGCPVVVLTRAAAEDVAEAVLRVGVDGYASKSRGGLTRLAGVVRSALFHARRRALETSRDAPFMRLFQGLPIGVFIAARDGTILEANPALAAILQYPGPEDLVRRPVHALFASRAEAERWSTRLEGSSGVGNLDAQMRRTDGSAVWVRVSAWYADDRDTGVRQIQGVVEETTEYHAAQEELSRRTAALAQSNEELEQMAYVVSHDLQQPLTLVTRYLDLLEDKDGSSVSEQGRSYLQHARRGAASLEHMVNAVLRYSRIETRGETFSDVDLDGVLAKVLERLADAHEEAKADITADSLPKVHADEAQMEQLFQNLLSNALKFRSQAPPVIHIAVREETGHWHLLFSDNGIGIAPGGVTRIFVMFQRLHTEAEYPGTGIGLAVCRRIVTRHGGRIWVESQPGRGATFHVTLPKTTGTAASAATGKG